MIKNDSHADLRASLQAVMARRPDAVAILAATSGIPKSRITQIMKGEGEPPTLMELTTLNMLKGA